MVSTGAEPGAPLTVVNDSPALVRKSRALSHGVGVFHGAIAWQVAGSMVTVS